MCPLFRIDDVSVNTSESNVVEMIGLIREYQPAARFILVLSPVVFDMGGENALSKERVFPKILNAYSDYRLFFNGHLVGVPDFWGKLIDGTSIQGAAHGLVHVDHRLLAKEAQEISILVSCVIVGTKIFVPPFNKWNSATELVCLENGVELVKFESGWKHILYQKFSHSEDGKYYFHTHDFDLTFLEKWLTH